MVDPNHIYESDDFRKVAFLIARGAVYVMKKPATANSDKDVFVLRGATDDMQADWQTHKDQVSARALFEAADLLRDILKGKKPRA